MARVRRVDASRMWATVDEAVGEAVGEVAAQTQAAVAKVGRQARKDVRANASRVFGGTGEYARGWECSVWKAGLNTSAIVHNETQPTLAHLLEYGHEQFVYGRPTGRRTPGRPHLEPAFQDGVRDLEELMRRDPR